MNSLTKVISVFALASILILPDAIAKKGKGGKKAAASPTLLETAMAVNAEGEFAGQFSTLLAVAGMDEEIVKILTSKGQHTVFAPTNEAFNNLFTVAAANCITLDDETVNTVLKYHIVKGERDRDTILESDNIRTILGAFFAQSGGTIFDNADQTANFVATDIGASNGIIHAIDTVILPFPVVNACEN